MNPADFAPENWTVSSNDALTLGLVNEEGAVTFTPEFTYPIFGDAEQIYGYKDLTINLIFDSVTMLPFLNVKYSEKLGDEVEDPQQKLVELLPESTIIKDEAKWVDYFTKEQEKFEIPGTLVDSYTQNGEKYDVFKLNLDNAKARELHRRLQIFVLLLIEAGSYIDETDPLWELYVVVKSVSREIIGFCTTYNYFWYGDHLQYDSTSSGTKCVRKKISQFIILPPHQGNNHGKNLYKSLIGQWLSDPLVKEITIEDPNESFDDLRDRCDLERLWSNDVISHDKGFPNAPIPREWLITTQQAQKMEKRQFLRCIEMALLHDGKGNVSRNVRLQIKRRLYEKNKEALLELDEPTRKDKIQTAFERLVEDYERIMERVSFDTSNKRVLEEAETTAKRIKT